MNQTSSPMRVGWSVAAMLCAVNVAWAQQLADPDFSTAVERPAHTRAHPRVVIDEAHGNFHTAGGRYQPFADLMRNDGYLVVPGKEKFDAASLRSTAILVIANATGPHATDDASDPAFSEAECDAVLDWVRSGGSLLLVADHTPYGGAAENLGGRFGIDMGKGIVFDTAHAADRQNPTVLVFSRGNGLLGVHPILAGRDSSEGVTRAVTFTGQSLGAPRGATVLFALGPAAREAARWQDLEREAGRSVGGRAQAVALQLGRGRVVVLGEAALLSAQVVRMEENGKPVEFKMGMNVPGSDDRQFALNVMRWLSGVLH